MAKFWVIPRTPMADLEGHLLLVTARRRIRKSSTLREGPDYTIVEADVIDLDAETKDVGLVSFYGSKVANALVGLEDRQLLCRLVKHQSDNGWGLPVWDLAPASREDEVRAAEYLDR